MWGLHMCEGMHVCVKGWMWGVHMCEGMHVWGCMWGCMCVRGCMCQREDACVSAVGDAYVCEGVLVLELTY